MTETRPLFGWCRNGEHSIDPLFLDPKGGYARFGRRFDPLKRCFKGLWPPPAFDHSPGARRNSDRVGGQKVGHDFEIAGIAHA